MVTPNKSTKNISASNTIIISTINRVALAFMLLINAMPLSAQNSAANIDAFLKARMKYYGIPGMQLAIIKDGKIIKLGAYGTANIPFSIPVTNKTLFPINSMTKCFTGVAIMHLVEIGRVKLDDEIAVYLDSLPEAWRKITVRQLLTHTSGLPDIVDGDTGKMIAEGKDSIALAKVKSLPMRSVPGEKSAYNQTNYVLLGQMIEILSKQGYANLIAQQQFLPAHLSQTRFGDSFDVMPNMAEIYSYQFNRNGLWQRSNQLSHVFEEFAKIIHPAAGINSTAEELGKWLISLVNGQFMSYNSLNIMWTPASHNDGTPTPRALGWSVLPRKRHPVVFGSGGMRSALYYYPQDKIGFIILTNLRGANPEKLIEQLAGFYLPELHPYTGAGLSPALQLLHTHLLGTGYTKAEEIYHQLQLKDSHFMISEAAMNDWGYLLLHMGRTKEAIEIFKLNTTLYANSGNTYDSLAEAYAKAGDKAMAIKNYHRSLEYSPENDNAKAQLKILQTPAKRN